VLIPNVSFLLILVLVVALGVLPLLGVMDLWSKRRFASTEARIGWTIALVVAGLPALVVYVILVVRSKDRVPLLPAT
jgi:NADH:ubiquinone oxidoreductase subunit 6 (subunit J)